MPDDEESSGAEWRADPFGRFELRLFLYGQPSSVVRVGDTESYDPVTPLLLPPEEIPTQEPFPPSESAEELGADREPPVAEGLVSSAQGAEEMGEAPTPSTESPTSPASESKKERDALAPKPIRHSRALLALLGAVVLVALATGITLAVTSAHQRVSLSSTTIPASSAPPRTTALTAPSTTVTSIPAPTTTVTSSPTPTTTTLSPSTSPTRPLALTGLSGDAAWAGVGGLAMGLFGWTTRRALLGRHETRRLR